MPESARSSNAAAGVVLAAGSSTRMGENKLLLPLGGETVVRRAVRTAVEAALDPIIVVLGHEPERVRAALAGLPCRTVVNPDHLERQGDIAAVRDRRGRVVDGGRRRVDHARRHAVRDRGDAGARGGARGHGRADGGLAIRRGQRAANPLRSIAVRGAAGAARAGVRERDGAPPPRGGGRAVLARARAQGHRSPRGVSAHRRRAGRARGRTPERQRAGDAAASCSISRGGARRSRRAIARALRR